MLEYVRFRVQRFTYPQLLVSFNYSRMQHADLKPIAFLETSRLTIIEF